MPFALSAASAAAALRSSSTSSLLVAAASRIFLSAIILFSFSCLSASGSLFEAIVIASNSAVLALISEAVETPVIKSRLLSAGSIIAIWKSNNSDLLVISLRAFFFSSPSCIVVAVFKATCSCPRRSIMASLVLAPLRNVASEFCNSKSAASEASTPDSF